MTRTPPVEGKRLTLSQLATYDDILTDALVDRAYFWTKIRKNKNKYFPARGILEDDVTSILLHDVVVARDAPKAEKSLLGLPGLKKFVDKLRSEREKEWFRRHLRKYIAMYLPDCPFEVTTTNRYTITTHEAAVSARKFIPSNHPVKYLSGTLVSISREEEKDLDLTRRDFSIVMSSRKKTASLFLGPARFANHDCKANAKLVTRGFESMEVVAVQDIDVGEEITVSYGDNYFGIDNCECLCYTCELSFRNGWAPATSPKVETWVCDAPVPSERQTPLECNYYEDPKSTMESGADSPAGESLPKRRKLEHDRPIQRSELTAAGDLSLQVDTVPLNNNSSNNVIATKNGCLEPVECDGKIDSQCDMQDATIMSPPTVNGNHGSGTITEDESRESSGSTTATSDPDVCCDNKSTEISESIMQDGIKENRKSSNLANNLPLAHLVADDNEDTELSDLSASWEMDDTDMLVIKRESKLQKKSSHRKRPELLPIIEHESPENRVPGDYTKTSKLLAQRYDRWVDCHTCSQCFVQGDAYFTRKECPRCERHSKLYGYRWPKTNKQGRNDTEERVMDHRTVHRFLTSEDETRIQRRNRGLDLGLSPTPDISDTKTETDISEIGEGRRVTRASRRAARNMI